MFSKPSLITRTAIGKAMGLVIGLIAVASAPLVGLSLDLTTQLAIILCYITLGGVIGLLGVWSHHPLLGFAMPWWLRGGLMGAWFHLLMVMLVPHLFQPFADAAFGAESQLASPYWAIVDGTLIGMMIGFVATRAGGEGRATLLGDVAGAR